MVCLRFFTVWKIINITFPLACRLVKQKRRFCDVIAVNVSHEECCMGLALFDCGVGCVCFFLWVLTVFVSANVWENKQQSLSYSHMLLIWPHFCFASNISALFSLCTRLQRQFLEVNKHMVLLVSENPGFGIMSWTQISLDHVVGFAEALWTA